ncbi:H3 protein, partial [Chauna torquata]|nr:H3 protein [Chauna torquata]
LAPQASTLRKKLRSSWKRSLWLFPLTSIRGLLRGFGVHAAAAAALRAGCEAHLLALLEDWGLCARHAKRVAVEAADVRLVRCLQGKRV